MKIMTKTMLFQILERLDPAEWQLKNLYIGDGSRRICNMIRLTKGDNTYCPITAAFYQLRGRFVVSGMAHELGREMGMLSGDVADIIMAADNKNGWSDRLNLEAAVSHLLRQP